MLLADYQIRRFRVRSKKGVEPMLGGSEALVEIEPSNERLCQISSRASGF